MKKICLLSVILMFFIVISLSGQSETRIFDISGELTTIYTLGNAAGEEQLIPTPGDGAYYSTPLGVQKNGYYTVSNLFARLYPVSWIEGYFKFYMIHRTGSFYLPLQMENLNLNNTVNITLDAIYGKASITRALGFEDAPVDFYMKAGRYKAVASNYGAVSNYNTELILDMFKTKTDFNYELGALIPAKNKEWKSLNLALVTNYRFNEAIQWVYTTDGAVPHGGPYPNKYAFQFLSFVKMEDLEAGANKLSAELLYGNNIGGDIFSGHSAGLSARYDLNLGDITIPIGILAGFYERNIDILGHAAVNNAANGTLSLRETLSIGLGTGLLMKTDPVNLEVNLGGTFNMVKHIYRNDLNLAKASLDFLLTYNRLNCFIGGGFIAGTLYDVQWKTRDDADPTKDFNGFDHTFAFANNFGFEVFAGVNLSDFGKFVIGFNHNRGLSLNHMLEAKTEGQVKYKQLNTDWNDNDKLVEAGGLYFKFTFKF